MATTVHTGGLSRMTYALSNPALDPALYRIEQTTCVIRSDLTAYVGMNPDVAQFIADDTGDLIVHWLAERARSSRRIMGYAGPKCFVSPSTFAQ
jgi:hypothetical protein